MFNPVLSQYFACLHFDHLAKRAVYLQLADAILSFIKDGTLSPKQKLPASRELSSLLKLNRITVSRAYDELLAQGWLESFVGKGTFVSVHLPDPQPKKLNEDLKNTSKETAGYVISPMPYADKKIIIVTSELHLDDGFPDPELAPIKELYRAYRNQLTRNGSYNRFGSYNHPGGPEYYKEALSRYLNDTRGLKTTPDNILSVRGTVMGINLVCNGLIKPGDVIVSGIPGWNRAENNFIHAGAEHIGLPVDEHGLVVDELRKICLTKKIRMVYVTPHHHYPTTVPLRIDRRLELLKLANEFGFIIFEDDYDYDFHYSHRPLSPLASADENGMVIYCGSFSKNFSPAFRMGYLAAPKNVIDHLTKVRMLLDRQGDHILDNAMAEILNDGTVQRYLRKTLNVYKERRDFFSNAIAAELDDLISFKIPEGGMAIWANFADDINLDKLAKAALQKGMYIADGKSFQYPDLKHNAIRMGFASSSTENLARCIEIIKQILKR